MLNPTREGSVPRATKIARTVLVVYVAALAIGILSPAREPHSLQPDAQSGEIIGQLADGIRNVLLFLPIGVGIMAWRRSLRIAVGLGIALSFSLELAQQLVPGRFPSPVDLAANSLGTALGAGLYAFREAWLAPTPLRAACLAFGAWVAVAVVLAGSALLLRPALTDEVYFGGWTPELGHFEHYHGRVLEARVGTVPISSGGPVADSAQLREALRSRDPIVIRAITGPPPSAIAPLVTISDAFQREILLIGVEGADLVLRWRTHSARVGFEPASFRCRGALAGLAVGEPFRMHLEQGGDAVNVEVAGRFVCAMRWTPGRTWSLLVPAALRPFSMALMLDTIWIALLVFSPGYYAWTGRRLLAIGTGLGALLIVLPFFSPTGAPPVNEWLGFAIGLVLGHIASHAKRQVSTPSPSVAVHS